MLTSAAAMASGSSTIPAIAMATRNSVARTTTMTTTLKQPVSSTTVAAKSADKPNDGKVCVIVII